MIALVRASRFLAHFLVFSCFAIFLLACSSGGEVAEAAPTDFCKAGPAGNPAEVKRYALLFGVADYPQAEKWKLDGPINDLAMFKQILMAHGYEEENICVLPDEHATYENVAKNFRNFLADQVDGNDQVAIFFSGHGTEVLSNDDDETYGLDQALVLYDSGVENGDGTHMPYMVDDDFAGLLSIVREKTRNITVVIDSCHSGSVTRGDVGNSKLVKLNVAENLNFRDSQAILNRYGAEKVLDNSPSWASVVPEGAIVLAAARDASLAYEVNGSGDFTRALYEAFTERQGTMSLQSLRQIISSKFVSGRQSPLLHGDPNQRLFSDTSSSSALNMVVSKADRKALEVKGVKLPSHDIGAIFRIYKASATPSDLRDAGKSVVMGRVLYTPSPVTLTLEPIGDADFTEVEEGDIAVLHSPSVEYRKFEVDVRALKPPEKTELLKFVEERDFNGELKADGIWKLVQLVNQPASFTVRTIDTGADAGKYDIIGPNSGVRNRVDGLELIAKGLKNHAKQWSIRILIGEGGGKFEDNSTLSAKAVGIREQNYPPGTRCKGRVARDMTSRFREFPDRHGGKIPLCAVYQIEVSADFSGLLGQDDIQVGAFLMLYDGTVKLLSSEDVKLSKERSVWRSGEGNLSGMFQATYPAPVISTSAIEEEILVFGVDGDQDFPWYLFSTDNEEERSRSPVTSGLGAAFELYFDGNSRDPLPSAANQPKWTVSKQVIRFTTDISIQEQSPAGTKEYTISDFDINQYIPSNDPILAKVLLTADALTNASSKAFVDGYPYAQHNWCEGSDQANLSKGIDCSRAIWYAFTRSNLAYTSVDNIGAARNVCQPFGAGDHGYLATTHMVGQDVLTQQFDNCLPGRSFKTGDVLVYRDEYRGVGHTVMVIDPVKKIAWGSHGWDGNPLLGKTADTGVEYQTILRKADWGAWDRSTMRLKACWRNKGFSSNPLPSQAWLSDYYCDDYNNGCPMDSD